MDAADDDGEVIGRIAAVPSVLIFSSRNVSIASFRRAGVSRYKKPVRQLATNRNL